MAATATSPIKDFLLNSIGLQNPANVWAGSGPVADWTRNHQSDNRRSPPWKNPLEQALGFSAREARARMSDLIEGTKKILTFDDLVGYLQARYMSFEWRRNGADGKKTGYLTDNLTGGSTPSKGVSPALSDTNVAELEAANRRKIAAASPRPAPSPAPGRAKVAVDPAEATTEEMRLQDVWRNSKISGGIKAPDLEAWTASVSIMLSREQILVPVFRNGTTYVGRPGYNDREPLRCLASPEKTRVHLYEVFQSMRMQDASTKRAEAAQLMAEGSPASIKKARWLEGEAVKTARVPSLDAFKALSTLDQDRFLNREFVVPESMTPKMFIAVRDKNLSRGALIQSELAFEAVAQAFGVPKVVYQELATEQDLVRREKKASVIDFTTAAAAFRSRATARPVEAGFGGVAPVEKKAEKPSIVIIGDDTDVNLRICRYEENGRHTKLSVYEPKGNRTQFDAIQSLPLGTYPLLIGGAMADTPSGFVRVEQEGVTMLDTKMRESNQDGPSHIPAKGAKNGTERFALDGRILDQKTWQAATQNPVHQAPATEQANTYDEEADYGFGYSAPA